MLLTGALYFSVPLWPLSKGWPIRAGLMGVAICLIPLTWQSIFTDSDAPGFGLLLLMMLPLPLMTIAAGLVWALVRTARRISDRSPQMSEAAD
jgi:hypothetical protein